MSSARHDLTAICDRLRETLREIEGRMIKASGRTAPSTGIQELVGLSDASIAADRLRFAAHFQRPERSGAPTAL